jgi:hypothetical protein
VLGSLLCFFLGEYPGTDLTGIAIDDVKIPTPLPLTTELNGFEFGPGPGRARALEGLEGQGEKSYERCS